MKTKNKDIELKVNKTFRHEYNLGEVKLVFSNDESELPDLLKCLEKAVETVNIFLAR